MANLSRLVSVQIALNTTGIKVPSFSDMIVVAPHSLSASRMMAITEAGQLQEMGLSSSSKLYKAAAAAFSQIPRIDKLYVGRQLAESTKIVVKSVAVGEYKVSVGSLEVIQVATSSSTFDTIATGLATKLAALSTVTAATATGGTITVKCGEEELKVEGKIEISDSVSTESMADCLTATKNEGGSWYGVIITSRDVADVKSAAEWTEANKRLFATSSNDSKIVDGANSTDIASWAKTKQMFRTIVVYDPQAATEYTEAAAMSKMFTYYPGSATWANKRLSGITADNIPEGQAIVARGKNANMFEMFNDDFAITQLGKVAAGEWIDIIRFRDWLEATMQADVTFTLINAGGKVPYTDEGIEMLANSMQQSLNQGITRGGIAPPEVDEFGEIIPSFVINKPRSSAISPNAKSSRIINDLTFEARLSGAIHAVKIKGGLGYII